jgi:hypothetical protein
MDVRVPTTDPLFDPEPPPPRSLPDAKSGVVDSVVWQPHGRGGGELCFPEDLSSAQRRALAGHLFNLDFDDAQQILDELAGKMVHAKVHNPIRYCVALVEKFKQGQFRPELGLPIADRRAVERLREHVLPSRWTAPEATLNASGKAIPPTARAAMDRLRGRPVSEPLDLRSDRAKPDDSDATEGPK